MPRRKSSTDISTAAWTLDECGPEFVEMRAIELGITSKGKARSAELAAVLADSAWIAKRLAELSAFELVLLETLVDFGGVCEFEMLWDEACRRARVTREFHDCEIDNAIAAVGAALTGPRGDKLATMLAPCITPLQRLVKDISVPVIEGPLPAATQEVASRVRNTIIAACRVVHRRVRATKSGAPSRTNLRRFDADVAASTGSMWGLLQAAFEWRLTAVDGSGTLVPDRKVIAAVAKGAHPHHDLPAGVDLGLLLQDGPVAVEMLIRLEQRAEFQGPRSSPSGGVQLPQPWVLAGSLRAGTRLGSCPELWVGEIGGVQALAAPRPTGATDGHVLPNFEVMLAPETSLDTVALVALAAELVRLDQIATFKLTPTSVRAAVVHGVELEEILGALDGVGSRPLPDNVRQSVQEWATTVSRARIIRDRVIVVPVGVGERLISEPRTSALFEALAPGVLRVDVSMTETKLAGVLDAVGVAVVPDAGERHRAGEDTAAAPEHTASVPSASGAPDPAANARVQDALTKRGFPKLMHGGHTGQSSGTSGAGDDMVSEGPFFDAPPGVPQGEFNREVSVVRAELKRWHGKLRPKARSKVKLQLLLNQPSPVLELAVVHAAVRVQILRRATKVDQVSRLAAMAVLNGDVAFAALAEDQPPHPHEFPILAPREVRASLVTAMKTEATCHLLLKLGSRDVISPALRIESIVPRGRDIVVHAKSVASDEDHAYALTSIASIVSDGDDLSLKELEHLLRRSVGIRSRTDEFDD
ncbi:MAG: helicase-associated domain-containing protein [Nannocystaceae bacterium]|nr:helicase-associated domain-containing protein [Nannocystaceae bacterium]